jgi:hypothetical protein
MSETVSAPRTTTRRRKPDPGPLGHLIDSWHLAMEAEQLADGTREVDLTGSPSVSVAASYGLAMIDQPAAHSEASPRARTASDAVKR